MQKVKTLTKKDFEWTKWTARDIEKVTVEIITQKKERYAKIKEIDSNERTFENTAYAIETSDYNLGDLLSQIHILSQVSPNASVRAAAVSSEKKVSEAMIAIEFDKEMYEAIKVVAKKKEKLAGADRKLFKDMVRGYKRMGFELLPEKQKELQKILRKLSTLSTDFRQNINNYRDNILVTKEELKGLPATYIQQLKRDTKTKKYIVSLDYPELKPFLSKAENAQKRKELSEKASRQGGVKNLVILKKIVALREKKAEILGYKNHAEYVIEVKTAKKPETVRKFIADLQTKIDGGVKNDIKSLLQAKRDHLEDKSAILKPYDIAFYTDKLLQKKYMIDSEKIREYFPIETVKKGVFKIYSTLFSVSFHKLNGYPLWHKDVELYEIREKGNIIAYFFLDLHPRANKYGHAMMAGIHSGHLTKYRGDEYLAPLASLVCNFAKSTKAQPSLLSHDEVETFFHEFGHLMHETLTKAQHGSQAGANTAWDFVEAPSQMLEHWVWDEGMLKILSKHYKSGKSLPQDLLKKMLEAKLHQVYYFTARQLTLGEFDLVLHTKGAKDIVDLYKKIVHKNLGIQSSKKNIFPAGFGHMVGYDAGYYGYMWSKVFADDMFSRFNKEGLLNKKTGGDYKKWILEKGSSEEEMVLVEMFLGRKPNNKAFLKEIGL